MAERGHTVEQQFSERDDLPAAPIAILKAPAVIGSEPSVRVARRES